MSLTPVTVTGTFLNPDGSPASGTVCATLSDAIVNGVDVIEPSPICGVLNSTGQLVSAALGPFVLEANDDAATKPIGTHYTFTVQTTSAPLMEFDAVVSHATSPVDISTLTPTPL